MNRVLLFCALMGLGGRVVCGQGTLDTIGVTALLGLDPTLTGSGVIVAQIETAPSPLEFEVNPGSPGQPVKLFAYRSTLGGASKFPNSVGSESPHADSVAEDLYGLDTGVAPGLQHVANYEERYFVPAVIDAQAPVASRVFNQSFEFGPHNAAQDQAYDDYIAEYGTVVASGVGDGGAILSPADCYNGLGVAAYGGASSTGPTADGRCKPDITAPASATSFSTPLVSGAAAILIETGRRQGVNAAAAIDARTVKALLLSGAVKPQGWTNSTTAPLDHIYGAGILNVYNSYEELTGDRHGPIASGLSKTGHPPLAGGAVIDAQRGWDYRSIVSDATRAGVNHYRITTSAAGALIATVAWEKGFGAGGINRLELYVYDSNGNLLGSSISAVDNVQHVWVTGLAAGTYEIEVVKIGGAPGSPGMVSGREVYALAWDFGR